MMGGKDQMQKIAPKTEQKSYESLKTISGLVLKCIDIYICHSCIPYNLNIGVEWKMIIWLIPCQDFVSNSQNIYCNARNNMG